VHLLCCSAQPGAITAGGLPPAYCAKLPVQARDMIDVPAQGKMPARQATVALRLGAVSLKHPSGRRKVTGPKTADLAKTIDL
jgi:hypothetical protein